MEAAIKKYQVRFIHLHFLAQAIRLLFLAKVQEPHLFRLTCIMRHKFNLIIKSPYFCYNKIEI